MSLRTSLIRLAHSNAALRPHLLSILASAKEAMEFPTQEALEAYLKEHPGADKSKHKVKKTDRVESYTADEIQQGAEAEYMARRLKDKPHMEALQSAIKDLGADLPALKKAKSVQHLRTLLDKGVRDGKMARRDADKVYYDVVLAIYRSRV